MTDVGISDHALGPLCAVPEVSGAHDPWPGELDRAGGGRQALGPMRRRISSALSAVFSSEARGRVSRHARHDL
jgi:hypothetical protein